MKPKNKLSILDRSRNFISRISNGSILKASSLDTELLKQSIS